MQKGIGGHDDREADGVIRGVDERTCEDLWDLRNAVVEVEHDKDSRDEVCDGNRGKIDCALSNQMCQSSRLGVASRLPHAPAGREESTGCLLDACA